MMNGYEGAKDRLCRTQHERKSNQMAKALAKQCLASKLKNCP